jgi:poly-gamma-glutamate synthesis protein (capsule biosynthesis protein)
MADSPEVVFCALGDVLVNHEDPKSGFGRLAPLLDEADVVFGNCEGAYSRRPAGGLLTAEPEQAEGLLVGSIDVMSCANNHVMDGGPDVMRDTLEVLDSLGIATVGAGENLAEARRPRVVERQGLRVAFVAFVSTFPAGIDARSRRPGVNPLRFHNHYYIREGDLEFNPGVAPEVMPIPYPDDLTGLRSSIEAAREQADIVIASFHWGEAVRPVTVHDYERETARVAIDAGAQVVVCHHPHIIRGVDFYKGAPIFHGLGNSVFHVRGGAGSIPPEVRDVLLRQAGEYAPLPYADYPMLPMHPESRISMVACCGFVGGKLDSVGIVPAYILPNGQVEPLDPGEGRGREVFEYLQRVTQEADLGSEVLHDGSRTLGGHPVLSVRPLA